MKFVAGAGTQIFSLKDGDLIPISKSTACHTEKQREGKEKD